MRRILLPMLLLLSSACASKDIESDSRLPSWFERSFTSSRLGERYELADYLSPRFLVADFNGDSSQDVAVLIKEKSSKKKGILLIHQGRPQYFVFGAGTEFGPGGDDYLWMNHWKLSADSVAYETLFDSVSGDLVGVEEVKLSYPSFMAQDSDGDDLWTGGVITWDGKKYNWIHRGE